MLCYVRVSVCYVPLAGICGGASGSVMSLSCGLCRLSFLCIAGEELDTLVTVSPELDR